MTKRHWYHLSNNWETTKILVEPRVGRVDDADDPNESVPFIAVCPTILQCIIAIGDWFYMGEYNIYQTTDMLLPKPAKWVFDYSVTAEHRLYQPTEFTKVEIIDLTTLTECAVTKNHSKLRSLQRNLEALKMVDLRKFYGKMCS